MYSQEPELQLGQNQTGMQKVNGVPWGVQKGKQKAITSKGSTQSRVQQFPPQKAQVWGAPLEHGAFSELPKSQLGCNDVN